MKFKHVSNNIQNFMFKVAVTFEIRRGGGWLILQLVKSVVTQRLDKGRINPNPTGVIYMLTLPGPGFQKLAQTRGRTPPPS